MISAKRIMKGTVLALSLIGILSTSAVSVRAYEPSAHRGAAFRAPENTLASFREAAKAGYKGVEFDVYYTHKGAFLVNHDSDLKRIYGSNVSIYSLGYHDRNKYHVRAGANWTSYRNETLPSLRAALRTMKAYHLKGYLHVKNRRLSRRQARRLARIIKREGMRKNVTVFSGNTRVFRTVSKYNRRTGLFIHTTSTRKVKRTIRYVRRHHGDLIIFSCAKNPILRRRWVRYAHRKGLKTASYAVGTRRKAHIIAAARGDIIFADNNIH